MVGKLTDDKFMSASRLPALLGKSPWSTPNDELMTTWEARRGIEQHFKQNEAMFWGDTLEKVVLREAAERLGIPVETEITVAQVMNGGKLAASLDGIGAGNGEIVWTDPGGTVQVATDDGKIVLDGPGVMEAKITSTYPEDISSLDLHRGPLQLQGQMMCTGYKWGCIAVLYRGIEMKLFLFNRHRETIIAISEVVDDFEKRLASADAVQPPEWFEMENAAIAGRIYPSLDDDAPVLDLDPRLRDILADHLAAKRRLKIDQEIVDETAVPLMEAMGNHEKGRLGEHVITWGMRRTKAQPEKMVPAKPATAKRAGTLTVKLIEEQHEQSASRDAAE